MSNMIPRTAPFPSAFEVDDALDDVDDAVEVSEVWWVKVGEDFVAMPAVIVLPTKPSTFTAATLNNSTRIAAPNAIT